MLIVKFLEFSCLVHSISYTIYLITSDTELCHASPNCIPQTASILPNNTTVPIEELSRCSLLCMMG